MFLPPEFLVNVHSQELMDTDDWDLSASYEYWVSLDGSGGGSLGWVLLSSSGQTHDSELIHCEIAVMCVGPFQPTARLLHHNFDPPVCLIQSLAAHQ